MIGVIQSSRRTTPRMRLFVPGLERALEMVGAVVVLGAIVLPLGWGYEQRQQARTWQETACAYRLREVARETNLLVGGDRRANPCALLRGLGLEPPNPLSARPDGARSTWSSFVH